MQLGTVPSRWHNNCKCNTCPDQLPGSRSRAVCGQIVVCVRTLSSMHFVPRFKGVPSYCYTAILRMNHDREQAAVLSLLQIGSLSAVAEDEVGVEKKMIT